MKSKVSLLCLWIMLSGCDNSSKDNQPREQNPSVTVVTLKTQPVTISMDLPGRTTAAQTADVRPQADGVILKRLFKEGADIKAGQQLYQIDPASYQASYEKAKAALDNDEYIFNRYKQLLLSNAVSKQTYDSAASDYAQAKADLKTAKVNLDYTKVIAPISGRIGRSNVTPGALVTSGQTTSLATITQLNPIYVDVSQPSSELLKIRRAVDSGQLKSLNSHEAAVKLTLEDGTAYPQEGRLEFTEVQVDEGTGSVILRIEYPNPNGILLPGMFVHSNIEQGVEEKGLLISQDAVMHNNKGTPYVYIVDVNNKINEVTVKTGQMKNGHWQITSGLKEGDRVVVAGLMKVSAGSTVEPVEQKSQENTKSSQTVQLSMTDPSAQ